VDCHTGDWLPEPAPARYRYLTLGAAMAAAQDLIGHCRA
jgi:hypothetical protein